MNRIKRLIARINSSENVLEIKDTEFDHVNSDVKPE